VTCRELADFILDYLSGDLAADVRAAFEHHLTLCPACVNYLDAYKATIDLTRRVVRGADGSADAPSDAPEELVRAILAARQK
jgi:anti-sigma factor RsiW